MNRDICNRCVSTADRFFRDWCAANDIPLHGIRHVATWEDWDDGMGVYVFLETISQRDRLTPDAITEMQERYLAFLRESGYPFQNFPNVAFEFDSDENVQKNYAGSYFNRLR